MQSNVMYHNSESLVTDKESATSTDKIEECGHMDKILNIVSNNFQLKGFQASNNIKKAKKTIMITNQSKP